MNDYILKVKESGFKTIILIIKRKIRPPFLNLNIYVNYPKLFRSILLFETYTIYAM